MTSLHMCSLTFSYYMASSMSGQDESKPALWLPTCAGKMELSFPHRSTRHVPQKKFPQKSHNKSFIDQACLVKMARYWPHSFFFASLWTSPQSQVGILTSHSVHNPDIWLQCGYFKEAQLQKKKLWWQLQLLDKDLGLKWNIKHVLVKNEIQYCLSFDLMKWSPVEIQ